jgi:hypothetical protein
MILCYCCERHLADLCAYADDYCHRCLACKAHCGCLPRPYLARGNTSPGAPRETGGPDQVKGMWPCE